MLFIGMTKKDEKAASRVGGLCIFGLTFKLLSYDMCSILNAVPGGLRKPFKGPLHRILQGDARVAAPEAHEHMVGHRLSQSVALLLQVAVVVLLQLGYLPPDQVKKWENDASFWCRVPSPNRAGAEGCQSSICLA
jgi:hypothetical protein